MASPFQGARVHMHAGTIDLTHDGMPMVHIQTMGEGVYVLSRLVGREVQFGERVVGLQRFCHGVHAFSAVVELQVKLHCQQESDTVA